MRSYAGQFHTVMRSGFPHRIGNSRFLASLGPARQALMVLQQDVWFNDGDIANLIAPDEILQTAGCWWHRRPHLRERLPLARDAQSLVVARSCAAFAQSCVLCVRP